MESAVEDGMGKNVENPSERLKGQIYFGGADFLNRIQALLAQRHEVGEIPKEQRHPNRPPMSNIFRDIQAARNQQIRRAHRDYGYTLQEIAQTLGGIIQQSAGSLKQLHKM